MTRVIVKAAAREDVLRQVQYLLERDAERTAERFVGSLQSALRRISQFPRIGAPKKLRSAALKTLRSWPIPGFKSVRIYYITTRSVVRVLRVLHDRQDLHKILSAN